VDMDCLVNLLAKQAVELSLKTGFENARQRVHQVCVDVLRANRTPSGPLPGHYGLHQPQAQGEVPLPLSLQLMPLYAMSLQKCLALRGGTDVRLDERSMYQHLVSNMDIAESVVFIYPRMFSLHNIDDDVGLPSENAEDMVAGLNRIKLPGILNLSSDRLTSDGIFLLDNGYDLFMWIGRNVHTQILNSVFGVPALDNVDSSQLRVESQTSDLSSRIDAVIAALRSERTRYMQLHFVREGDGYAEAFFARFLVEDRCVFVCDLSEIRRLANFFLSMANYPRVNPSGRTLTVVRSRTSSTMPTCLDKSPVYRGDKGGLTFLRFLLLLFCLS